MVDVFSYLSSKHSLLMDRLAEMNEIECVRKRPHSPLAEDIFSEMLSEDMLCSDQESEDDVPLFNAKGFPTVSGKCPPSQFLVNQHPDDDMLCSDQESKDDEPLFNAKGFPTVAGKCPPSQFLVSQHPDDDMIDSDQESEDDEPLFNAKGFPTVAGKCPRPEFLVSQHPDEPLLNAKGFPTVAGKCPRPEFLVSQHPDDDQESEDDEPIEDPKTEPATAKSPIEDPKTEPVAAKSPIEDPKTELLLSKIFGETLFGYEGLAHKDCFFHKRIVPYEYFCAAPKIRRNLPNEYIFSTVPEVSEDYVPDKFLLQQDFIHGRITGIQYYVRLFKNDPMVVRYLNKLISTKEMEDYFKSLRPDTTFKIFWSKNPDLPLDIAARVYRPELYDIYLGKGIKTKSAVDSRIIRGINEDTGLVQDVIPWNDGSNRAALAYTPFTEDPTDILGPVGGWKECDAFVPIVPETNDDEAPETVVTANPEINDNEAPEPVVTANPETNDDEAPELVVTANPETKDDEAPETNDDLETDDSETIILQKEIKDLLDQHRAKAVKRVRVRASRAKPKAPVVVDNLEVPVDAQMPMNIDAPMPMNIDAADALMPMDIDAVDVTDVPRVAVKRPRVRASRAKPKAPVVPEPFVGDGPVAYFSVDDEPIADPLEPIAPEPVADAPVLQQAIVRTYTTKEQGIEEAKIPKNKSYSEWLPLQQYPRVLQQVNETYATKTDIHEMTINDLYALGNSTEAFISRSSNAIIRHQVMKGQAIEQLVILAKQKSSRSKIGDIYAEVNASLQRHAMEHGESFFEIKPKRMQELRVLGEAAEYLELDKYDLKCSFKKLIRRVPQIVKEAKSLNPVVEKRPAVRHRSALPIKKQRVE